MLAGLILDGVIAVLLTATVLYCRKLNKRIMVIQDSRKDLQKFVKEFDQTVLRADRAIETLKTLGDATHKAIHNETKKAQFLVNDLSFLAQKGEDIAENLERQMQMSRHVSIQKKPFLSPEKLRENTGKTAISTRQISPSMVTRGSAEQDSIRRQNVPPQQKMSPSKKKLLEEALAQIARHKKAAEHPGQSQNKPMQVQAPSPAPSRPSPERHFNRQRFEESLKAIQQVDS